MGDSKVPERQCQADVVLNEYIRQIVDGFRECDIFVRIRNSHNIDYEEHLAS
jgi:hypothetical protein